MCPYSVSRLYYPKAEPYQYIRGYIPHSDGVIRRRRDNRVLVRMVDDLGDLLGVALEDGHHLLRVLVEHGRIAIVASRQQSAVIGRVDIQRQNARYTSRVETLGK